MKVKLKYCHMFILSSIINNKDYLKKMRKIISTLKSSIMRKKAIKTKKKRTKNIENKRHQTNLNKKSNMSEIL